MSKIKDLTLSGTPMSYEYAVDDDFAKHFRSLHQVFMYITDRCNLGCEQCIYKPSISHFINEEIVLDDALALLRTFHRLGARKVTFLGGEPTLYGHCQHGKPLLDLIDGTARIGYEYIRLDTNGQKTSFFLRKPQFSKLNELAFSLDGFSPGTNDPLRGRGTFDRVVDNIRLAIELGYRVTITCCAQKVLLTRDEDRVLLIERMIRFAEEIGAHQINFHDLFKVGTPMDTWTGSFAPEASEWLPVYDELSNKIAQKEFSISVRLPQCFIRKSEFDLNPEYYGYCPVKLGERVMVHPNGVIRICSNLICTGFGVARYHHGRIIWDYSNNNETAGHDLERNTPCTNRSRHRKYGDLVPLCFSFKPGQEEFVWYEKLHWETKRDYLTVDACIV
ncbi:MAG: radical SAM protein [Candidatus Aenigmarchaeota archaeon]|nr:radical SAM protein [Candidatus Aenigmarchaeota archaeon]MBI5203917.1 radical SAM protein [Nitrospirota bacterium]